MKINALKILSITAFLIFLGAGVSLADDDDRRHHRDHGYGHYKHKVHHHYRYSPPRPIHHHYHHYYAPPRPVYVERHYRPVVVERHYYPAPIYYAAPAPPPPIGFFFGMSVADAGSAFSLGVSGR
jgi:hypothetical protein